MVPSAMASLQRCQACRRYPATLRRGTSLSSKLELVLKPECCELWLPPAMKLQAVGEHKVRSIFLCVWALPYELESGVGLTS